MLEYFSVKIKLVASKQAVPIINKSTFANIKFFLPALPEQRKIAEFLRSIDIKIEVIEKELSGMQEWKKGLLQQMFV